MGLAAGFHLNYGFLSEDPEGKALIDHIAVGPGLNGNFGDFIPQQENGVTLSDHTGIAGKLELESLA
jgi:hypothetical protein